MMNRKSPLFILLLLLVSLAAVAQDERISWGCRRGTPRQLSNHTLKAPRMSTAKNDFYIGDRHQLVVLAAFADLPFSGNEAATLERWGRIFNEENFSESPFVGSVHDYFYDQSYGQFNLTFDLQYVALSNPHAKYGSTAEDDENSQFLIDDIVDELLTRDIDWSRYDWNDDGNINQLLVVYAGKGSAYGGFGGDRYSIWPHQWWLSEHLDLTTVNSSDYRGARTVGSGDAEYIIDCYCVLQELGATTNNSTFGTICHEYSHCFGFPDFYGNVGSFIKGWDLMDYGNNNGNGYHPCGYSAHERMFMGWLEPVELTESATITAIPALADEAKAYLLRNDGHPDEFYVIENRQQKGWDASLPGNGLMVFHIDFDEDVWTSIGEMPNTIQKQHYNIFAANNRSYDYSNWGYPYGNNDQLTNTSSPAAILNNPNADGTRFMSKPLTNMAVTDGLASFDVKIDIPEAISEVQSDARPQLLYQLGPISIVRDAKGRVKKIGPAK